MSLKSDVRDPHPEQGASSSAAGPSPCHHLAAYRFFRFPDFSAWRDPLRKSCQSLGIKGTILISPEGINLFVAGSERAIHSLLDLLETIPGCGRLQGRWTQSAAPPFRRLLVRLKKEIIAFGVDSINPCEHTSPKLAPETLKQWLDEGRDLVLLDTRNRYEVRQGTFAGARDLAIDTFRQLPEACHEIPADWRDKPVVTFCTGGIRCEKAAPFLESLGLSNVFQLEGGILNYFERCGGAHYNGECFVFDQRVGVDPELRETDTGLCHACRQPLGPEDLADPRHVRGISCPFCFRPREERIAAREAAITTYAATQPGCTPYENRRPLRVPAALEGSPLLSILESLFPHGDIEAWRAAFAEGRFRDAAGRPFAAHDSPPVGTLVWHHQPATVEPPVATAIRLLHEDDDLIVLEKPAPLPMHPSGRYHKNTLQHFLNHAYAPEKPRPVHRLDANVGGIVLFGRRRAIAGALQQQFKLGQVEKIYLALVTGHPEQDEFDCRAPITTEPGHRGGRSIDESSGVEALTLFRTLERHPDGRALVEARPVTGRTNQIRIHLAACGHPILGDPLYGGAECLTTGAPTLGTGSAPMCLHAARLTFTHPTNQSPMTFTSAPPWLPASHESAHADPQ